MEFSILLFIVTASLLSVHRSTAIRDVDERLTKFLYADDPSAADIVSEYQLHRAPSGDYEEDEDFQYDHKPGEVSDYEATRHVRPYFLEKKITNPRVVVFYSPWSGGSQDFKPSFVDLAKEMHRRQNPAHRENSPFEFHAISCSAHIWVCHDNGVKTYPTVKAYRAGDSSGTVLKWFTADAAAMALGVNLEDDKGPEKNKATTPAAVDDGRYEAPPKLDILGASFDGYKRTKNDLYNDAALSFMHALRMEIFQTEDARLNDEEKSALVDWLELLYWTLPPTWKVHTLILDIRSNIDTALEGRAELIRFIETHSDVVLEGRTHWTDSCSHGRPGEGYACGMWGLLHIVSVGVHERHNAVLGGRERVSTAHAAMTMRNYIEHFFKYVCGRSCQRDFVQMFDSCGFKHCKRFQQSKNKKSPPSEASWKEFALWMFEVHNDITKKLLRDEALSHGRKANAKETEAAAWPSPRACRLCRWDDGKWNYDSVFSYLRTEYWPGGVHNFRFVVLEKKNEYENYGTGSRRMIPKMFVFFVGIALASWAMKKQHLLRTGRHKKYEGDFV